MWFLAKVVANASTVSPNRRHSSSPEMSSPASIFRSILAASWNFKSAIKAAVVIEGSPCGVNGGASFEVGLRPEPNFLRFVIFRLAMNLHEGERDERIDKLYAKIEF